MDTEAPAPKKAIAGVYSGRIVVYGDVEPHTLSELEAVIESALREALEGSEINVSLTRTDR